MLLNYFFWNQGDGYADILVLDKCCTQVKFLDGNAHVLGLGRGDNNISHNLGSVGVISGSADIPWAIKEIVPNY